MADKYAEKEAAEKAAREAAEGEAPKASTKRPRGANPPKAAKPIAMVAGLGNPGPEYALTRHNVGFMTVDELARRHGGGYWKSQDGALVTTVNIDGRPIVLVKPQSYMNTSGGPISKLLKTHRISVEELLVVHDDMDIPAGDVRVKIAGGHGGHNGLRSIIDKCGSRDFTRVRFGIGRPPGRMDPADYVLRQLKGTFLEEIEVEVQNAADAVEEVISKGAVRARDDFNGRHRQQA